METQTFQLNWVTCINPGISKSTGKKALEIAPKTGDIFFFWNSNYISNVNQWTGASRSLVPRLQFLCPLEKECSLKTVLHMCKPEDGQPGHWGQAWHWVLGPQSWVQLSLAKCALCLHHGFTRVDWAHRPMLGVRVGISKVSLVWQLDVKPGAGERYPIPGVSRSNRESWKVCKFHTWLIPYQVNNTTYIQCLPNHLYLYIALGICYR